MRSSKGRFEAAARYARRALACCRGGSARTTGCEKPRPRRGVLGLTAEHGLAAAALPLHHGDPFGRLLVAQARSEGLALLTADRRMRVYDIPTLDAAS